MRIKGIGPVVVAAVAGVVLAAGVACANTDGLVLRAVGFVKGKGDVTQDQIKCEVPTVSASIIDGTFNMGLWNTYGAQTLFFPDVNNPFANPCGGWLQMRNNMVTQGITVDRVNVRLRIAGAKRFRTFVQTRNNFPIACKQFRNFSFFIGTRLDGFANANPSSDSGLPNVAFTELLPLVSTDLIHCLRAQYASLPIDADPFFVSLPLVARVYMTGTADNGSSYRSNTVSYTLTLRHTCGNGRVDDGELCDSTSPGNTCGVGPCTSGHCTGAASLVCATDADCTGSCLPPGGPSECTCLYN